jgi:hypothetical protein
MARGDLTDLASCYAAAGITSTSTATDADLASLITAISSYVPAALGVGIAADNYIETYVGNGKDKLMLRQRPVILVSNVSWRGASISTQVDPITGGNGVYSDGRNAILSGFLFPQGETVRVAYSAGYVDTPPDVSLAVAELVAEAYSRRRHVGETSRSQGGQVTTSFDTKAMHAAIADKLSNYKFVIPC